jgi:ATP-dependent Clp protease, protease subunit
MLFSRKAVTDSLLSKLIPKRTPVQKNTKPAVKAADLEKRLSLLSH